ncbi:MAG: hypothetical protein U5N85_16625 [Arcicella sp.]|nr:hypothetical protein [Arcicella sp.]
MSQIDTNNQNAEARKIIDKAEKRNFSLNTKTATKKIKNQTAKIKITENEVFVYFFVDLLLPIKIALTVPLIVEGMNFRKN